MPVEQPVIRTVRGVMARTLPGRLARRAPRCRAASAPQAARARVRGAVDPRSTRNAHLPRPAPRVRRPPAHPAAAPPAPAARHRRAEAVTNLPRPGVVSARQRGTMEFRILGPLEVHDDGRSSRSAAAKQRALLALLLLHANEALERRSARRRAVGRGRAGRRGQDAAGARLAAAQGARRATASLGRRPRGAAIGWRSTASGSTRPLRARSPPRAAARSPPAAPEQPPARCRGARAVARRRRWPTSPTSRSPQPEIERLEELRLAALEAAGRGRPRRSAATPSVVGELRRCRRAPVPGAAARAS